ncbi:hypothetical protein HZS_6908 [Henneguya salminicola]|nr:hypothetical protein HZS_6908 [Henneguya salminicola]
MMQFKHRKTHDFVRYPFLKNFQKKTTFSTINKPMRMISPRKQCPFWHAQIKYSQIAVGSSKTYSFWNIGTKFCEFE